MAGEQLSGESTVLAGTTSGATPRGGSGETLDDVLEEKLAKAALVQRMFGRQREPARLGRFALLRKLGHGGMGTVYAGYDEDLDRRVAIKVLRTTMNETARARVVREARSMAQLTHPNVVQVYEAGESPGDDPSADPPVLYIAMEYVDGQTLDAWQTEHRDDWETIVDVYLQAGEGLHAAHLADLVHRDFKPTNVMVTQAEGPGRVKVLDFGLARRGDGVLTEPGASSRPASFDSGELQLTAEGDIMGTPAYMAPEQFHSADVGPAADQFSFCVALWEALHGARSFRGDSLAELALAVTSGVRPTADGGTRLPTPIAHALERGLATDPAQRWPTMRALLDALRTDDAGSRGSSTNSMKVFFAALWEDDDRDDSNGPTWNSSNCQGVERL